MLSSKQIQIVMTAVVLILAVVMPVETFHLLMEIVVEIYELLEFTLDEVIHHVFETSRHTTQVIVFYLMLGMFLYGLYRLARLLGAINLKVKTVVSGWHAICTEIKRQRLEALAVGQKSADAVRSHLWRGLSGPAGVLSSREPESVFYLTIRSQSCF